MSTETGDGASHLPSPLDAAAALEIREASTEAHATKAMTMIEKLKLLDEQREKERSKRLEARTEAADPRESIAEFNRTFEEERRRIEGAIRDVADAGPRAAGIPADEARTALDTLAAEVATLESLFAQSAYFLPPYEQRSCTSTLTALVQQIEDTRAAVLPKKKFAFSRRGGTSTTTGDAAAPAKPSSAPVPALVPAPSAPPPPEPSAAFAPGMGLKGIRGGVTVLGPADLEGKDFTLTDVEGGDVYLLGSFRALRLHGLRGARVFLGPVKGSCFLEDVRGCEIHLAAHQIRVHATFDTVLCMRVKSRPIIEHCERLKVAPYCLAYPALPAQLARCQLPSETGMWREVDDFGWIKAIQSPNWEELPEAEARRHEVPLEMVTQAFPPEAGKADAGGKEGRARTAAADALGDDDEL